MTEKTLWKCVRDGMRGRWHAQRHEDGLSEGIPDASYACGAIDGWIELKCVRDYPRRGGSPVRVKFRRRQIPWLSDRVKYGGGMCWVLLQVARDYYLFHASLARDLEFGMTREELARHARGTWRGRVDFDQLHHIISGSRPS